MKFLDLFSDKASLSLVRRLWQDYIKPYKLYIVGGLVCMAIAALTTAFLAQLLQPLFDDVFVSRNEAMLYHVALMVFAVFILKGISGFGESVSMIYVGQKIIADIQK